MVGLVVMGLVFWPSLAQRPSTPILVISGQADPAGLACPCAARAGPQLFRAGRLCCSRTRRRSIIPSSALSELGADPDSGIGDSCDRHRQPSRDHWCLLLHAAGIQLGLLPRRYSPHVRKHCRPDLLAARQPAAVRRRSACYPDVPSSGELAAARPSVTATMVIDSLGFLRGLEVLGLAGLEGGVADGAAATGRARSFPRRQRPKDSEGGWLPRDRPGHHAPSSHGARLGEPGQATQERRSSMAGAQARGQAPHGVPGTAVFLPATPIRPRSCTTSHNRCCTSATSSSPSDGGHASRATPRAHRDRPCGRILSSA